MKLSNAHGRLLESLASGFHHVRPNSLGFTELGRKDVKVDILISRLMGLHVQQFAFKLSNLTQMSLVLQFIKGQVIFLCNHLQVSIIDSGYTVESLLNDSHKKCRAAFLHSSVLRFAPVGRVARCCWS